MRQFGMQIAAEMLHNFSIRIFKCNVRELPSLALSVETMRTTPKATGIMGEAPELTAADDLFGLRVNRHHAAARKRSDIGAALLVESKIPSSNGTAPIAHDAGERAAPLAPVGELVGKGIVWTSLRPIHLGIRVGIVYSSHPLGLAEIAV